jgi:hypothetical protein
MAKSRDAAKEQYWRRVIRRLEASGLGVRRFCEQEGLAERRLHWWRRTLRQRDQERAGGPARGGMDKSARHKPGRPARGKAGSAKAAKAVRGTRSGPVGRRGERGAKPAFVPVELALSVAGPIEVVHPRGHVVRIPAVFDAAALGRVLAAIDGQTGVPEGP